MENIKFYIDKCKDESILREPIFFDSIDELKKNVDDAIKALDKKLDKIAALKKDEIDFQNVFVALDDINFYIGELVSKIYLMMNVSIDRGIREMCEKMLVRVEEWSIHAQYREDVYAVLSEFPEAKQDLSNVDKKLYEDIKKRYKRIGMDLSLEKKELLKKLKQELTILELTFSSNIREKVDVVKFSNEELRGVSDEILLGIPKDDEGKYIINPKIQSHVDKIMKNAELEAVRKKIFEKRMTIAKDENMRLLVDILSKRDEIAKVLGYKTWADYKLEMNTAKKSLNVFTFLDELKTKLEDKFQSELDILRGLKIQTSADSKVNPWDVAYYENKYIKTKYDIDLDELRVYFSYENVLSGMFDVFSTTFGIRFEKANVNYVWHEDVDAYVVMDRLTNMPLGLLYLDMFPREGKYSHFAQFGVIGAKKLEDGKYQCPAVALICNFDKPNENTPSLLTYNQVKTLFHECGHALHSLITTAEYIEHSGTSVPIDFVEVPSQLMEYFVEDINVLEKFAFDYRDKSKVIPREMIEKLKLLEKLFSGIHYRTQIVYATIDMDLHSKWDILKNENILEYTNNIFEKIYLPVPDDTSFVTGFGHLMGYDAGYYGYAWADVMASNCANKFRLSENGFLDEKTGINFRRFILETGSSREVLDSLKEFLGGEYSLEVFLKDLGC